MEYANTILIVNRIIEPGLGWALASSRIGASHRRNNTPCQDAHAVWAGSSGGMPNLMVTVADGHGDERHDRSQLGAALAVQAAVHEMQALHSGFDSPQSVGMLIRTFKTDFPRRVNRRWRAMVLDDVQLRPETPPANPEELAAVWSRYGTTLLTAFISNDLILLAQIGDGDILFIRPDGSIDPPFPHDESLIGTQTYSLSSTDAHNLWQTTSRTRGDGGYLLLATDGLSDAFANTSEFHTFVRSLVDRVEQYGLDEVARALPGWLDHYSSQGSGDDVTLALAAFPPEHHEVQENGSDADNIGPVGQG